MQSNANYNHDDKSKHDGSKTITTTQQKYNVFEDPALKFAQFFSETTFGLISSQILQSGYKILPYGISSLPTIAFGVAKGINKKESAGQIFYNMFVDCSVGAICSIKLEVYLALLISQAASHVEGMKQSYLQATALNEEDEFERQIECGIVSAIALPNKVVESLKGAYPQIINNLRHLVSHGHTIKESYLQATALNEEDEFERQFECDVMTAWSIPNAFIDAFLSTFQPVIHTHGESLEETNLISFFCNVTKAMLDGSTHFNQGALIAKFPTLQPMDCSNTKLTNLTKSSISGSVSDHVSSAPPKTHHLHPIQLYNFQFHRNPFVFNHAIMNIFDQSDDYLYLNGQSFSDILHEIRQGGIQYSIFNVSSNISAQYQSAKINPQFYLMPDDKLKLPVSGKFSISLKELRLELSVPLLEAGKTGNPYLIALAFVVASGMCVYAKKIQSKYKLLNKKVDECEKLHQDIQTEIQVLNAQTLRFTNSGMLDISLFEQIQHAKQFLNKTSDILNERLREVKVLNKVKTDIKEDAKKPIREAVEYCDKSKQYVNELSLFFTACQVFETGNYQACLNFINSQSSMTINTSVKNLKFQSYIQLNDLDSARKILPELEDDLQSEYQEKIHIADIQHSLKKITALISNAIDQQTQQETIESVLYEMDKTALNLKDCNKVLYYQQRAEILDQLGFDDDAKIESFRKIQELDELNSNAIKGLAKIYIQQQQFEKAIPEIEKISNQDAEYKSFITKLKINLHLQHFDAYLDSKNYNAALETLSQLDTLLIDESDKLLVALNKGDIHLRMFQVIEAEANAIKDSDEQTYHQKLEEARLEECKAINSFQLAQAISGDNEIATVQLTKIHLKNNDLISAISEFSKIQHLNDSYASQIQELQLNHQANELVKAGHEQIKNKDSTQALKNFKKAQELVKEHIPATLALADCYLQQGDFDSAIAEVKKISGFDDYLADINFTRVIAYSTPFIRALNNCAQNHLQHDQMNQSMKLCLKLFSAWHHIHPQSLAGFVPMLVANYNDDTKALHAYSKLLSGQFEPFNRLANSINEFWQNKSFINIEQQNQLIKESHDVIFLLNNVMQGVNVVELNHYVPYFSQVEYMLWHGQIACMTYQIADDINLVYALQTGKLDSIKLANINLSSDFKFLISYFKNSILPILDYLLPSMFYSEPEEVKQCLIREFINVCFNAIPYGISESIYPWTIVANLIGIAINFFTGHYNRVADHGCINHARKLILQGTEKQEEALQKYNRLPDFQTEKHFVNAVLAGQVLNQITFSPNGARQKVDSQLACALLSRAVLSPNFQNFERVIQNNYLQQIKNIAEQNSNGNLFAAFSAQRTYAIQLANMGYLFAAEEAIDKAILSAKQITTELPSLGLFKYLANLISLPFLAFVDEKKQFQEELCKVNLEDQKHRIHQIALAACAKQQQSGFGVYLMHHIHYRVYHGLTELNFELSIIKALSVLYADKVQNIKFDGQNKLIIDYQDTVNFNQLIDELTKVILCSENKKLIALAGCLQVLLTDVNSNIPMTLLVPIRSDKIEPEARKRVVAYHQEIEFIRDDNYDFIQYFLDLMANKSIENHQLEKIIQQFMENIPNQENAKQFNYQPDENRFRDISLVETYLSGIIGFSHLFKSLIEVAPDNLIITNFKNEVLSKVLMCGYYPPVDFMMSRIPAQFDLDPARAQTLLDLYDLNSKQACIRIKLNNLVELYKAPPVSNSRDIRNLGDLYHVWGNLVRKTLFKDTYEKTNYLFNQIQKYETEEKAIEFATVLLKQGANLNAKAYNISLLHYAVRKNWPNLVKLFCQYGHHLEDKNYDGVTPLQLAIILFRIKTSEQLTNIKKILVEYGSSTSNKTQPSIWYSPVWWSYYAGTTTLDLAKNTLNWNALSLNDLPCVNRTKKLPIPIDLQQFGIRKKLIAPDGNCLYASIAYLLNGEQQNLRHLVADYLIGHQDNYEQHVSFEASYTSFEAYVRGVRYDQWGGEVELEILSKITQRSIIVIQNDLQILEYNSNTNPVGKPLFIFYNGIDHYDALETSKTSREIHDEIAAHKNHLLQANRAHNGFFAHLTNTNHAEAITELSLQI